MQLQAGSIPCSKAAAAKGTETGAEEVLVQPSSSTKSPAGPQPVPFIASNTQMYANRYAYSLYTHNSNPPGTMS